MLQDFIDKILQNSFHQIFDIIIIIITILYYIYNCNDGLRRQKFKSEESLWFRHN